MKIPEGFPDDLIDYIYSFIYHPKDKLLLDDIITYTKTKENITLIPDIIVIDGEDHFGPSVSWSAREYCFEISQSLISSNGGIIVVDDSWRYPKISAMSIAKEIIICESTGPCRKGVTRTDLHLY